jgi:cobyrinic acid a,c-diamide synthase
MARLLPVATSYARRKLHLGYRVATPLQDGPLGRKGARLVGHEFHYASIVSQDASNFADVTDATGVSLGAAGHRNGKVTGTFFHVLAG